MTGPAASSAQGRPCIRPYPQPVMNPFGTPRSADARPFGILSETSQINIAEYFKVRAFEMEHTQGQPIEIIDPVPTLAAPRNP